MYLNTENQQNTVLKHLTMHKWFSKSENLLSHLNINVYIHKFI